MSAGGDAANVGDIHAYYVRQARVFYAERLDLGYDTQHARAQAMAYLRRKTGWDEVFAAGAIDSPPPGETP